MRSRRLNNLSICGAVLLVLTAALWIRNRRNVEHVAYHGNRAWCSIASRDAILYFAVGNGPTSHRELWKRGFEHVRDVDASPQTTLLPSAGRGSSYEYVWAEIPCWLIMIAALTPAGVSLRNKVRASRRRARGLCLVCGYDLRASSQRCPECGTSIEKELRG